MNDQAPGEAAVADPPRRKVRARVTERVVGAQRLVDDARETLPPVDIAFAAVERDGRVGGFLLAGAIAFRFFMYLLPLYLLVLVAAGAMVSFDPESPSDVAGSAGLSQYVASMIGDAAETSRQSLWILGPLTLWALFTAGRSVHKVLAAAHANAWGVPVPRRTKPHLVALAVLGFAVFVTAGIVATRYLRSELVVPLGAFASASYFFAVWLAVSLLLPRRSEASLRSLVPGAVLVSVGIQGLYLFNVLYLNQKIESASDAYGALGVAASLLLWLYLLGRLMVAAPVLNATLWERSQNSADPR